MTLKISQLPVAPTVAGTDEAELNQSLVSRSCTLEQIGELGVPTQTADEMFVDVITSRITDSTVTIEGGIFETSGTTTNFQLGDVTSPSNTLITNAHFQAKRDLLVFMEADTDDVATGDQPIVSVTANGNRHMFRYLLQDNGGDTCLDCGGASSTPDIVFLTGGDYVTAPATGTRPTYIGGGKTAPTEALRIRGADQFVVVDNTILSDTLNEKTAGNGVSIDGVTLKDADVTCVSATFTAQVKTDQILESTPANGVLITGLELPTTGGTAATLDFYEEFSSSFTFDAGTAVWTASQSIDITFVRIGNLVTMHMEANLTGTTSGAPGTDISSSATAIPAQFRPKSNLTMCGRSLVNNTSTAPEAGSFFVTSGGTLTFRKDQSAPNWDAGQPNTGFASGSWCWSV